MLKHRLALALLMFNLALAACATAPPVAPQPLKQIDTSRFFNGRWYEIARTPMSLTKGCVAGTTDYITTDYGQLIDRDGCEMGTPEGQLKTFAGPVRILNPGENNKVKVTYIVYGVIPISRVYWMLDVDDNYQWFIVTDPAFDNLSLFFRNPRPSAAEVSALMARTRALGYDTAKLEMPEEFPPGQR